MQRRDWLQRSLITAGVSLSGSNAQAQTPPPQETDEQRRLPLPEMVEQRYDPPVLQRVG